MIVFWPKNAILAAQFINRSMKSENCFIRLSHSYNLADSCDTIFYLIVKVENKTIPCCHVAQYFTNIFKIYDKSIIDWFLDESDLFDNTDRSTTWKGCTRLFSKCWFLSYNFKLHNSLKFRIPENHKEQFGKTEFQKRKNWKVKFEATLLWFWTT